MEAIISNLQGLHKFFEKLQNGVKSNGPGIHVILGLGPNELISLVETLHRLTIGKHFNVFRVCLHYASLLRIRQLPQKIDMHEFLKILTGSPAVSS